MKIEDNFFCDKAELRTIDYREYLFWLEMVFGAKSREFKSALPDTNVWVKYNNCLSLHTLYYLRHPAYNEYPIVGISQQQAIDYSKWRSDRVFERVLVEYDVVQPNPNQNAEMYFSIENYFKGEYNNIQPDTNILYYPVYRLPTLQEREKIILYADSLKNDYFKKCKSKRCKNQLAIYSNIQVNITPCPNDSFIIQPTRPTFSSYTLIDDLKGNVSEWSSENGICTGGGWADSKERVMLSDTFMLKTQNAWTGFRNVCEWIKYEK